MRNIPSDTSARGYVPDPPSLFSCTISQEGLGTRLVLFCKFVMIILSVKCYCGTCGLYRDIPLMKVSVGRDSENSLKIMIIPLKSGLHVGNYVNGRPSSCLSTNMLSLLAGLRGRPFLIFSPLGRLKLLSSPEICSLDSFHHPPHLPTHLLHTPPQPNQTQICLQLKYASAWF